ncbi:MAG: 50S ribosomal protein L19e [Candidatus Woesearchaeota archaeon]
MNLKNRKRVIASTLGTSKRRIVLDPSKLEDIKKAITKTDIRSLVAGKAIKIRKARGQSSFRSKKLKIQKSKGMRKGAGSKKGKKYSRVSAKRRWVTMIRTQRVFIRMLKTKEMIASHTYRNLYTMIKSNRFRSIRLIKLYLEEHKLFLEHGIQKKKGK